MSARDTDDDDGRGEVSTTRWFGQWIVYVAGVIGPLTLWILQVSEYFVYKPDVLRLLLSIFDEWIEKPTVSFVRWFANVLDWSAAAGVAGPNWAEHVASAITLIGSGVVLYFSALGLAKLYDWASAEHSLKEWGVFGITVLVLPLGGLSIIHLTQDYLHFVLPPGAQSLVDGYRALVHPLVEAAYWLPAQFFQLTIPSWFKDLATLSVISVGMSRKAWLVPAGVAPGSWDLDWDSFSAWISETLSPEEWDWMKIVTVVPQLIAMFVAQVLGTLGYYLFLGKWRWPAQRIAAASFVVLRGLMMVGLVYPIGHASVLFGAAGQDTVAIRAARLYAIYAALTAAFVLWVVWLYQGLS